MDISLHSKIYIIHQNPYQTLLSSLFLFITEYTHMRSSKVNIYTTLTPNRNSFEIKKKKNISNDMLLFIGSHHWKLPFPSLFLQTWGSKLIKSWEQNCAKESFILANGNSRVRCNYFQSKYVTLFQILQTHHIARLFLRIEENRNVTVFVTVNAISTVKHSFFVRISFVRDK